mmetsp:Transcript_81925/g.244299  ORF Transcript_81925/g.244299 Transcript_81925/m.244299 type:complete len:680 (-) Transcript_81925:114-2153(-)
MAATQGSVPLKRSLTADQVPVDPPATTAAAFEGGEHPLLTPTRSLSLECEPVRCLPLEAVVKIEVTSARRSFMVPWQVQPQTSGMGSGFAAGGARLVVTNAHVVQDANTIYLTLLRSAKPFPARIACTAPDVDIALLAVDSEDFWEGLKATKFCPELPALYSEVNVVGYPMGGSTVCVTKGVISRFDTHLFSLAAPDILSTQSLMIQIDAAINPGNSGGPVFGADGRVVGVAAQKLTGGKTDNIGYVIPIQIALNVIEEFRSTGCWSGVAELGFTWGALESEAMSDYLKVPQDRTGVVVRDVAPLGCLHKVVLPGDVLLSMDGKSVNNNGTVELAHTAQSCLLCFEYLVSWKAKGSNTRMELLRQGEVHEVSAVLGPVRAKAPRFDAIDCEPSWFLVGGIVFSRFASPMLREVQGSTVGIAQSVASAGIWSFQREEGEEVCVLLRGLRHHVNRGIGISTCQEVRFVNGRRVYNLRELAARVLCVVREGAQFLTFGMVEREGPASQREGKTGCIVPSFVLRTKEALAADHEILRMHRIPGRMSEELLPLEEECAAAPRCAHIRWAHVECRDPLSARTERDAVRTREEARAEAAALLQRLNSLQGKARAEAFVAAAKERSDCFSFKDGGDLGFCPPTLLPPAIWGSEVPPAVKDLEEFALSSTLESPSGVHILLRLPATPP